MITFATFDLCFKFYYLSIYLCHLPRKLHAQQQEFQAVYECIDKITQFMSRAAIFSFMPILTKLLPESVTSIERGRYYRNRSEL